MCTKKGQVKKTSLEQYSRPRSNGINAITIKDGDELLEAKLTTGNSQILMSVKSGKCIRESGEKQKPPCVALVRNEFQKLLHKHSSKDEEEKEESEEEEEQEDSVRE